MAFIVMLEISQNNTGKTVYSFPQLRCEISEALKYVYIPIPCKYSSNEETLS